MAGQKEVVKITVEYDDGTIKEVEKGVLGTFEKTDNEKTIAFEILNIAGKDITDIVFGIVCLTLKNEKSKEDIWLNL